MKPGFKNLRDQNKWLNIVMHRDIRLILPCSISVGVIATLAHFESRSLVPPGFDFGISLNPM
jgi:hypothetical protein